MEAVDLQELKRLAEAAKVCDQYPQRDPGEDGNGYWAAEECAKSIRALKSTPASPSQPSSVAMTDAHEVWAAAQLLPGEGILDGVMRIENILQSSPKGASTGTERVNFRGINPLNPTATAALPMVPDSWRYKFTKNDDGSLSFDYNDYGDFVAWKAVEPFLSPPQEASKPQDEREAFEKWAGENYRTGFAADDATVLEWDGNEQGYTDDRVNNAWLGFQAARASQPSAASGRELPALPIHAGTVFNDGYWLSEKGGPLAALPNHVIRRSDFYTADQMRDYALAALSAAPADANVGGLDYEKTTQSLPEGWKLIAVNSAFDDLMFWLERCESKGHLEKCPDLVEPWERFDYRATTTAPEPSAPADKDAERWISVHDRLPHKATMVVVIDGSNYAFAYQRYNMGETEWYDADVDSEEDVPLSFKPTHWTPLPAPLVEAAIARMRSESGKDEKL